MTEQRNEPAATADRRAELVESATAIVRESGFGAATVKTVTARAGMSAGLLYRYAEGVDELLADVFRRCAGAELTAVDAGVAAAGPSAVARLVALVDVFAHRALRGHRLAWALLVEPVARSVEEERLLYRRGYAALMTDVLQAGIRDGEFVAQNPSVTAAGLVGAIGEALAGPLSPTAGDGSPDPTALVAEITNLCLRAVGARKPEEEQ